MKHRTTLRTILLSGLVLFAAVPASAQQQTLAQPASSDQLTESVGTDAPLAREGRRGHRGHRGHRGDRAERRGRGQHALREYVELNLDLGNYYMLAGDYQQASEHFLAVAELEPPARGVRGERAGRRGRHPAAAAAAEATADAAVAAQPERGADRRADRRAHRRAERAERFERRAEHVRLRAYTMAATALYLSGDVDGAMATAADGLALVDPTDVPEGAEGDDVMTPVERFIADPETFSARFASGPQALESRLLEIEARLGNNAAR
jgi:hypothetical protein